MVGMEEGPSRDCIHLSRLILGNARVDEWYTLRVFFSQSVDECQSLVWLTGPSNALTVNNK